MSSPQGHNIKAMAQADADRIRGALPVLTHGLTAWVMTIHLAATAVLSWIVFTNDFPYPIMYPLMGLLLWLFIALRFIAQYTGQTFAAGGLVVTNLVLLVFWVWVLLDKVPGRPVIIGRVTGRPELPILYVPIAMYSVAGLSLLVQLVVARLRRKS
ncbi:MAG: hypothetical protein GXP54_00445 [Deltaproteobacteria bacterium]|nr:hypothetical protein [Deltaproteobacteria bacterium]